MARSHVVCTWALAALAALIAMVFEVPNARADGGFVPARSFPGIPTQPRQRALIAFDGTSETLIVESTMAADRGDRFAWILPLPAAPTSLAAISPGALNTLEFCYGPSIKNFSHTPFGFTLLLLFAGFVLTVAAAMEPSRLRTSLTSFLWLMVILSAMSLISVGGPASPHSFDNSAQALKQERVGNYDVAVMQARTARDLSDWLASHDFASPPPASGAVIDDYLANGWVMLVAQLHREPAAPQAAPPQRPAALSPHPLRLTFPTPYPVYPMRLTAMAGSMVDVTLFVLARERVAHPDFETIYANNYDSRLSYPGGNPLEKHTDLAPLVQQPGWLTQLHAKLTPAQMTRDIELAPAAEQSYFRQEFYTPEGAFWLGLTPAALWWAICLPLAVLLCRRGSWIPARARAWARTAALLAAFIPPIFFIAIESNSVPTIEGARTLGDPHAAQAVRDTKVRQSLLALIQELPGEGWAAPAEAREAVRTSVLPSVSNPFTRKPTIEEQSPGNYEFVEKPDGALTLVFYDESCGVRRGFKLRDETPEHKPNF